MIQEERDQILLSLKNNQEKRDQMLIDLKEGQEKLISRVDKLERNQIETNCELRKISQTVARIEHEHGEKLQAALDGFSGHSEKIISLENKLDKHENILNKHADQIYYLNSKVQTY